MAQYLLTANTCSLRCRLHIAQACRWVIFCYLLIFTTSWVHNGCAYALITKVRTLASTLSLATPAIYYRTTPLSCPAFLRTSIQPHLHLVPSHSHIFISLMWVDAISMWTLVCMAMQHQGQDESSVKQCTIIAAWQSRRDFAVQYLHICSLFYNVIASHFSAISGRKSYCHSFGAMSLVGA